MFLFSFTVSFTLVCNILSAWFLLGAVHSANSADTDCQVYNTNSVVWKPTTNCLPYWRDDSRLICLCKCNGDSEAEEEGPLVVCQLQVVNRFYMGARGCVPLHDYMTSSEDEDFSLRTIICTSLHYHLNHLSLWSGFCRFQSALRYKMLLLTIQPPHTLVITC